VGQVVGGIGVAHNPFFPLVIARDEPGADELRRLYGALAEHLRGAQPDTIVFFTTDHYNEFFEHVPIFSIGVAEIASGPSDYPMLPHHDVPIDGVLAKQIQNSLVESDFDVGMSQEFQLDHTITAPLGLLLPELDIPLVPVFVSASMRPIPSAARCYALGQAIRAAVEQSPLERRVLAMASGAFSFEVGGPRMSDELHVGVPSPEWTQRVVDLLDAGDFSRLVQEATPAQIEAAGNAAGEVLDWIAMAGMLDPAPPAFIDLQLEHGHAYAAWRQ
jgi:aromatic ring-opening dioxygenase catalytic subunit (LigB family)